MKDNTFQVGCPSCETLFEVTDPSLIGQIVACPKCGGMMMIEPPSDSDDSSVSPQTQESLESKPTSEGQETQPPISDASIHVERVVAPVIDDISEKSDVDSSVAPEAFSASDPSSAKQNTRRVWLLLGTVCVLGIVALGLALFARPSDKEQGNPPTTQLTGVKENDAVDVDVHEPSNDEEQNDALNTDALNDEAALSNDNLDDFHSGVNVEDDSVIPSETLDGGTLDEDAENENKDDDGALDVGLVDDELGDLDDVEIAPDDVSGDEEETTEKDAIPTDFDEAEFERENQAAEETTESDEEDLGSVASTTDVTLQDSLPTLKGKPVEIDVDARMALEIHSIVFPESPAAAVRLLSEFSGVPIEFDIDRFVLLRPSLNKRLDLRLDDVDVAAALEKEAEMLKWDVVREQDRIVIEPQSNELSEVVEQRFDVADILGDATPFPVKVGDLVDSSEPGSTSPEVLVEFVKSLVAPNRWGDDDGEGRITVDGAELVVAHDSVVRKSVEILLEQLRVLRRLDDERRFATEDLAPELRGWETLSKKTPFNLIKPISLQQAVSILEGKFNFLAIWDDAALNALGVGRDSTTNVRIASSPVVKVLSDVLEPFRLNYVILDEKLILITTNEKADSYRTVEIHGFTTLEAPKTLEQARKLTKEMTSEIAPEGWNDPDVAIWLDVENGCWIIRQSQTVQRKIRAWTSALLEKEKAKEKKKSNDVEPSKNESTLGTSSQPSE